MFRCLLLCALVAGCADNFQPVDVSSDGGAAFAAWEDAATNTRIDQFAWGGDATTPVADFLFVLDPSISMRAHVGRVQEAFDRLAASDVFPAKSRIAVLSTTPAEPQRMALPHPAVKVYQGILESPGFQELVSRDSIAIFRTATTPELAATFALDGCDRWFAPGDHNAAGVPCLTAHTQIPLVSLRAEAGMTALAQFVARNLPQSVFRPGASVNVIFVSDTHDPGMPPAIVNNQARAELVEMTPTADALRDAVMAVTPVSALRFHAIAPYTECGEPWSELGPTYLRAAEATGGQTTDLCTATDYTDIIRRIAREGARMQHAVFPLGRPAAQVERVRFDGAPAAGRSRGPSVVEVPGLDVRRVGVVEVRYRMEGGAVTPWVVRPVVRAVPVGGEGEEQGSGRVIAR
jgi:hypothetical protein